ncbi:helix-turn-helix transcriptional regulator [Pseudomonas putida CSV86]|uniref:Transcriptional regulator n=2 Tax=Pseudomonas TaxID=286 RepID=A0A177SVU5_PSEPU|nr:MULTISPECIES: helix-turn-helix transcriptional regulator [Pseudomonas]MDG9883931.1 helix-turn-helix domain-containing protein [Pseudomonas sp. GD04058]NNJ18514.1 helix-turn-helix transcriptional regulator [Pseudomonas bharatica CSV86]OAI94909.1 transcriptional regulator [Pseudomonas putida]
MEAIGRTIKNLRKQKGLSQSELASQLGMSRSTISGIENNTVPEIGIRKVEAILNMLGYTLTAVAQRRRPTLDQLKEANFHEQ